MGVQTLYKTSARATGGRDGETQLLDGNFRVKLSRPTEMGGHGEDGSNPEQLFALGWSACFLSSIDHIAKSGDKVKLPADAAVVATIGIGPRSEGGFGITAALEVSLPGIERTVAEDLIKKADGVCPYSNATRGNVDLHLSLI